MGATNLGNQILTFDYKQEAKSSDFNKLIFNIQPSGIYSGGNLSVTDALNEEITITPMVVFISDNTAKNAIRIETQDSIVKVVDSTTPYIIAYFDWFNVDNNYMDIDVVAWSTIDTYRTAGKDVIVLGKAVYDGATLTTTIDSTMRDESPLKLLEDRNNYFKIVTTEISSGSTSNKVYMFPGQMSLDGELIVFSGGESSALTDTTSGRIDLIYLRKDGTIQIVEGIDDASPESPVPPNDGVVFAKITRGASRTDVKAEDITQIDFRSTMILTSNTIPIGGGIINPVDYVPPGWLRIDGSQKSRTTYAKLFAIYGTKYGNGDGSTTFNIPDYAGYFLRVTDRGAGVDPDAASRTDRGDGTTGDNVGTIQQDEYKSHNHGISYKETYVETGLLCYSPEGGGTSSTTGSSGGNETRGKNVNVDIIIRAY